MTTWLLVVAVVVVAVSGLPGLVLGRRSSVGQWIATVLNVAGSCIAGAGIVLHHLHPEMSPGITCGWALPFGRFAVGMDAFTAIFLIPIFLISALGAVYGMGYWAQREHPSNGRRLRLCWGLLTAGLATVVLSRDSILFLMGWEVMALTAFFLVATEEHIEETRKAAWVYLVATHVGTLSLFGFFALLRHATGSFELWTMVPSGLSPKLLTALFVLGAVGFGLKAGLMPLHIWLPGAHANAPSHVSAILSGVMLKVGIYGLIRVAGLTPLPPAWWGGALLIAGTISGVVGIAFAIGQHDLKRLLAYSSIENVGIIVMGLGLALIGRSFHRHDLVTLGMGGALLHMLNHSLFKPLLFMGAGGVLHATHTRQMDLLGGLGKTMPGTFLLFVVGAVAISGLPPLNGFVGELLLYLGFMRTATHSVGGYSWAAIAAPALALIGALAVACFAKMIGTVFAGASRSAHTAHAHDPARSILLPMWLLAICCLVIGVIPQAAIGLPNRAVVEWMNHEPGFAVAGHVSLGWLTVTGMVLIGLAAAGAIWLFRYQKQRTDRPGITWDCGYAAPTARMQYSGSSSSQMLVELLRWLVWPRRKSPKVDTCFARKTGFQSEVPDAVLDRGLLPAFGITERVMGWARVLQGGSIHVYVLYILATLLALLLFA